MVKQIRATNLSQKHIYYFNNRFFTGCVANDNFLIVSGSSNVSVNASNQNICYSGYPSSFSVGNTTGTYSWSPASYFVDPNIQNPVFISSLSTTTVFTVVFTDLSGCIATDSITINVNLQLWCSLFVVPVLFR